ncbi:efflux RND transporter periplasmic adaptor subunit [Persicobacter psychrovividus]|uniref:MexH family multidrug efflux RND transporter periplasmic adaptor subunit n=1 Tax=Persicobacter psychrovividus TaxID=387638 RepID=A0ABM7VJW6_9BACT|nr:MexH family multidrug efflux RND transporter periplasmic adaptor subunit [Persicobacter psychrovividus]
MKKIYQYSLLCLAVLSMASCKDESVKSLTKQVDKQRSAITEAQNKIQALEAKIKVLDPTYGENTNPELVAVMQVKPQTYIHQVEVRGRVESRDNVMVASEATGRILKIHALEGDKVRKGQVIMEIDAENVRDQIAEVETNLSLAKTIYEKRADLWKENIGKEVDYLEAKTNYESLSKKLKTLKTQLGHAYVKAPFAGTLDYLPVNKGELVSINSPLFRLVGNNDMLIRVALSEKYLGHIRKGDSMQVEVPNRAQKIQVPIAAVSNVIDLNTRTFMVEARLEGKHQNALTPNMLVKTKMTDFSLSETMVVPTESILADHKGQYVFTVKNENGKSVVHKLYVEVGSEYAGNTWVKAGLKGNEMIVTKGQFKLNEGNVVRLS